MSGSAGDVWIGRVTTVLLIVCALTMGYGFLMPSPAAPAPAKPGFHAMAAPAAPVRLVVPAVRIKAPVLPIEVNAQAVLDPPSDPHDVGWWRRSARPGGRHGQTVLTGHTVHTGGGVMDDLGKLRKGQRVKVVTPKGTMVYATTKVVTWTKEELAKNAVAIFNQKRRHARLVLITCSGWTGSFYTSNVVVFAKPLGVRDRA